MTGLSCEQVGGSTMSVRKVLFCSTAALAVLSWGLSAEAADQTFKVVNCSALKGQAPVCLVNNTNEQVTDIGCETTGFFGGKGEAAVDLPRGGIPANSLTIIFFKKPCNSVLIFTVLGGGERRVPGVHTDQMTLIEVPTK